MHLARFLLIVSTAGCGTAGALGQAHLAGQCAAGDEACSRRRPVAPIAVGTRFHPDISAEIAGSTAPSLVLESATPDVVAIEDGALVGRSPGASAVLISTDDGSVVDFIHVWVAPVTKLTLARRDGDRIGAAIGLVIGEDVTIQPALWSGAQRLSGEAELTWTVADPNVLRDGSGDRRRLRAKAPGTTTVVVAHGDAAATLDLEVVP
jgi:hypothetical protein